MDSARTTGMDAVRHLTVGIVVLTLGAASPARAQATRERDGRSTTATARLRIDLQALQHLHRQPPVSAALHPAAKGAIIGGAIGAASFGALGLWYCTIGPSEVGECGVKQWAPGLLVWGAIGAGVGALIGSLR